MTDEQQNTAQEPTGASESHEEAEVRESHQEAMEGAQDGSQEAQEAKTYSEEYVKKLREENASWRTKLREAQETLEKAKSPEDYEALQSKLATIQKQYELDQVKFKATKGLPESLVDSVTWPDSPEGIEAQAKALAAFAESVGTIKATEELNGGLDPRSGRSTGQESPEQLARRYNKRISQ